jgi:hypothetical protein
MNLSWAKVLSEGEGNISTFAHYYYSRRGQQPIIIKLQHNLKRNGLNEKESIVMNPGSILIAIAQAPLRTLTVS